MASATALVLVYHRVAFVQRDPQRLAVSPVHFDQQLDVITSSTCAISLDEAMRRRTGSGRLPVAVTFDDGYADTWSIAAPMLQARGVPATVFVTTGALDDATVFWWDDLERSLLEPTRLPPVLELRTGSGRERLTLDDRADRGARQRAYDRLHAALLDLSPARRQVLLSRLRSGAPPRVEATDIGVALNRTQVQDLARMAGVEIGSHAHTHARLASLSARAQYAEMTTSREILASLTGRPPAFLAYPFGQRADITRSTPWLVRAAGYRGACMGCGGPSQRTSDRWRLPRVLAPDLDAESFERWLTLIFTSS